MKDIKYIIWDFHSAVLVMPGGGTWGYRVGGGGLGVIFFSEIQPELVCELLT